MFTAEVAKSVSGSHMDRYLSNIVSTAFPNRSAVATFYRGHGNLFDHIEKVLSERGFSVDDSSSNGSTKIVNFSW